MGKKLSSPFMQLSGGGGKHIFFKTRNDMLIPGIWGGGEIKTGNGYVILDPSNHLSGNNYKIISKDLIRKSIPLDLPKIPRRFLKAIQSSVSQEPLKEPLSDLGILIKNRTLGLDVQQLKDAVMAIKNDSRFDSREEWLGIIAAINHETNGSEEGFELAYDWSQEWDGGSTDYNYLRDTWKSFKQSDNVRLKTGRHILKLAARDGWSSSNKNSEKDTLGKLKFFTPRQLNEIQDLSDFVEELLYDGTLSVVYGPPGAGKSFFVLDLALHVATGKMWNNLNVEEGIIVYLALEGIRGIKRRFLAWGKHHGVKYKHLPVLLAEGSFDLREDQVTRKQLIQRCAKASKEWDLPVRLIIIDTLARSMNGGDENSSIDMTSIVSAVDELREQTDAHIMLVHHSGKDVARGARGHSSLRGAVDTEIRIERKDGISVAAVTKQKDGDDARQWKFFLEQVNLGSRNQRGKPIYSAVVVSGVKFGNLGEEGLNKYESLALLTLKSMLLDADTQVSVAEWISETKDAASKTLSNVDDGKQGQPSRDTIRKGIKRATESLVSKGAIKIHDENVNFV